MTTGEELLTVLRRLRDAARGSIARDVVRERHDWRVVETFVRRSRASQGREGDDVAQETMMAIAKHVVDLDARDPSSAVAWCTRIALHKRIDFARARARRIDATLEREGDVSAVDLLERDDGHPIDDRALAVLIEAVEEAILSHVDALPSGTAADRHLKRLQGRATLHRVLGAETDPLRAVLGLDPGFGADRLAKWVERGRPLLLTVLERMAWDHEGDARAVIFTLRDAAMARRADAGLARPERRKTVGEETK